MTDKLKISTTFIKDLYLIQPLIHEDNRGWFSESYSNREFLKHGLDFHFLQDNHSKTTKKNTIRGLHYQEQPMAQTKLVRCVRGEVYDVAVDLRKNSSTYLKWFGTLLSEKNQVQMLIPKGFAHGFLTLTDDVELQYKVDQYYSPEHDRTIRFDDPKLNINWGINEPILSEKDSKASFLNNI
jgi:dTDP-4-dehydrorhamnose 3,5-epimerase